MRKINKLKDHLKKLFFRRATDYMQFVLYFNINGQNAYLKERLDTVSVKKSVTQLLHIFLKTTEAQAYDAEDTKRLSPALTAVAMETASIQIP